MSSDSNRFAVAVREVVSEVTRGAPTEVAAAMAPLRSVGEFTPWDTAVRVALATTFTAVQVEQIHAAAAGDGPALAVISSLITAGTEVPASV